MSERSAAKTALTVAGVTAFTGLLAYAAYFDYKRRNDAEFRRKLRKEKKKVDKSKAQAAPAAGAGGSSSVGADELRAALEKVRSEDVPQTAEQKEQYFMSQVSMGEQLCQQGPLFHLPAALCFYRALRVYPSPVELIMIYEKTVPPPVFQLVMEMTNMDVTDRVGGYYNAFPAKSMNVTVKDVETTETDGTIKKRKALFATRDFNAGETIYTEEAVVAVLDHDLQIGGSHCTHCLREIPTGQAVPGTGLFPTYYCSSACETKAKAHYQTLLFAPGSALPAELAEDPSAAVMPGREEAQAKFIEFLRGEARAYNAPHLLARFLGRQIAVETAKMIPGGGSSVYMDDLPPVDQSTGMDYGLWDHVERLRFLAVTVPDEEHDIMKEVLSTALPGLESFLTDERHATLKGKLLYNAFGICPEHEGSDIGGRDNKPASGLRPEDQEKSRTPYGTSRQIGSGFYAVSAYLNHSCDPSAKPVFRDGTARLSLVTTKDIKAGDEITVAYVDVSQHADETAAEARKRRRWDLVRGWRFACVCSKCVADGATATMTTVTMTAGGPSDEIPGEEMPVGDESQVEDIVLRGEAKAADPSGLTSLPDTEEESAPQTPTTENSYVEINSLQASFIESPTVPTATLETVTESVPAEEAPTVEAPTVGAPVAEVVAEVPPVEEPIEAVVTEVPQAEAHAVVDAPIVPETHVIDPPVVADVTSQAPIIETHDAEIPAAKIHDEEPATVEHDQTAAPIIEVEEASVAKTEPAEELSA